MPSSERKVAVRKELGAVRGFLAEREEILKHKWIESEKAGTDIGFEKALLDWILKHRSNWREKRMREARRNESKLLNFFVPLTRSSEVAKGGNDPKEEVFRRGRCHGRAGNRARVASHCARDRRGESRPRTLFFSREFRLVEMK